MSKTKFWYLAIGLVISGLTFGIPIAVIYNMGLIGVWGFWAATLLIMGPMFGVSVMGMITGGGKPYA